MSVSAFAQAVGAAAAGKKKPPKAHPFTPFVQPARPPAGLYDPGLDSQEAAATRGYQDLTADTGTANTRASDDFTLAQNRIQQQAGNSFSDLLTSRTRGLEDYNTQTGERSRQYANLGISQADAAGAAGLAGGGAGVQAALKRQANQGREQGFADQALQRFTTDNSTARSRTQTAESNALADAALGYGRGAEDRGTALTRAGRENTLFGGDVAAQRFYQATGTGWEMPTKPSTEGTQAGITYHHVDASHVKLPSGEVISNAELKRRVHAARAGSH